MNILLLGPNTDNPGDGIIRVGIEYILKKAYNEPELEYLTISNDRVQKESEFFSYCDLIVICGTPWLWDNFQYSVKYNNLRTALLENPGIPVIFMGIGSCLPLNASTNVLERTDEVTGMNTLFNDSTIIVRDHIAHDKLKKAGINSYHLPCPSFWCYGSYDFTERIGPYYDTLVYQHPRNSISASVWTDEIELNKLLDKFTQFRKSYNFKLCVASEEDRAEVAYSATFLSDPTSILHQMKASRNVLTTRVHCAIPAFVAGAKVELLPLDTRANTLYDFQHVKDFSPYLKIYIDILRSLFTEERVVGPESQRLYDYNQETGFFNKYMGGLGLDIGYTGYEDDRSPLPIRPGATGVDKDYPGYDGKTLPFQGNSQDYVYSSHCLEHISDPYNALKEWHRVVKPNGYIVIIVPHQYLYEKKYDLPSHWNQDHKHFYTPGELLKKVEMSLKPNTYRVRLLEDGDKGFNYKLGPDKHSDGQYEIVLVLQKIHPPDWDLA